MTNEKITPMIVLFIQIIWRKWKNIFLFRFKVTGQIPLTSRYCVMTSRCSYELLGDSDNFLIQPGILWGQQNCFWDTDVTQVWLVGREQSERAGLDLFSQRTQTAGDPVTTSSSVEFQVPTDLHKPRCPISLSKFSYLVNLDFLF